MKDVLVFTGDKDYIIYILNYDSHSLNHFTMEVKANIYEWFILFTNNTLPIVNMEVKGLQCTIDKTEGDNYRLSICSLKNHLLFDNLYKRYSTFSECVAHVAEELPFIICCLRTKQNLTYFKSDEQPELFWENTRLILKKYSKSKHETGDNRYGKMARHRTGNNKRN